MNEFKIKKGLIVTGEGGTVVDIQGQSGQLFSVTDSLIGVLMSVNDISGLPILEVSSDNTVKMGTFGLEGLIVSGSTVILPNTSNLTGDFLTIGAGNVIGKRTPTQVRSDIGAQAALTNPVTGTGASGQVSFWNGTTTQTGNNNLFWDNANGRLGIGITTPLDKLHIQSGYIRIVDNAYGEYFLSKRRTDNSQIVGFKSELGGDLSIFTTDIERWRITSGGTLQSNGAQRIQTSTGNLTLSTEGGNGNILLTPNGTGFIQAGGDDAIRVQIGTGSRGNVTISSPFINGDFGGENRPISFGNNLFINSSGAWQKNNNFIGGSAIVMGATGVTGAFGGFTFVGMSDNDISTPVVSTLMKITGAGNVGIGTTSPASKLEVLSGIYNGLTLSRTATNAGTYIAARGWDTANVLRTSALIEFAQTSASGASNGRINFFTYISNTANLRWSVLNDGVWESNGAQTIRTSTGNLTLATNGGNGNILLTPNGTGKVGIGTTSPGAKLHIDDTFDVTGNFRLGDSTVYSGGWARAISTLYQGTSSGVVNFLRSGLLGSGNSLSYYWISMNTTTASPWSSTALRIYPNKNITFDGNVGIGTTSPASRFHVSFQNDFDGLRIQNSNRGHNYLLTTAGTSAEFFSIYDVDNSQYLYQVGSNGHGFLTGGSTKMVITSSGNVGIGTTSPSAKIHGVNNNFSTTQGFLFEGYANSYSTTTPVVYIKGNWEYTGGRSTDPILKVAAYNDPNGFYIIHNGNVGIGVTTPSERLHVSGRARITTIDNGVGDFITTSATGVLTKRTAAQVLTDIGAQAALTNPITGTGTSGQVSFFTGTTTQGGDNGLFWDNTNKRLGIGTTSPSQALEVIGKAQLSVASNLAPINLPRNGTSNPSGTVDGDIWYRSSNLYYNNLGTIRAIAHTGSFGAMSIAEGQAGTATTSRYMRADRLGPIISAYAPTLTGTGASGTWDINITGNAATATTATNLSREVIAGNGLTGGGILNADRTLNVGAGDGISVAASAVAVDNTVVRTTGNQTIDGVKTFSNSISVAGNNSPYVVERIGEVPAGTDNPHYILICRLTGSALIRKAAGTIFGARRSGNSDSGIIDLHVSDTSTVSNVSASIIVRRIQGNATDISLVTLTFSGNTWLAIRHIVSNNSQWSGTGVYWQGFKGIGIQFSVVGASQVANVSNFSSQHPVSTSIGDGNLNINGTIAIRASSSTSSATQIPVFTADPSSTTRLLVTRTPAQLRSDIGAQASGNYVTLDTTQTITGSKTFSSTIVGSINGNAATATTLETARTINGTSFNGSANITTANWGTARTITIGSTGKSVNGSGNVSWSLAEIGAQASLTNPITGTGSAGQVSFWNGTNTQTGDNGLYWNDTNKRLGIGVTAPPVTLSVQGISYFADDIYLRDGSTTTGDFLVRIYDSSDDGIIDVYRNNSVVNRIHGNGNSFFNAGNVGIGTTSPSSRLVVQGADTTSSTSALNATNSSGTSILFVRNDGNVGINNTSPTGKLDIQGVSTDPPIIIRQGGTGAPAFLTFSGNYGGWVLENTDTGGRKYQIATTRNASSIGGGRFIISDITSIDRPGGDTSSSGNVRICILGTGEVGIGVTTPSERLHISGRARITTIDNGTGDFITTSATGVLTKRTAAQVLTDIGGQAVLTNPITGTGSAGQVSFWTDTTTQSGDNALWWDNTNKRLGIGTTTPIGSLEVVKGAGVENNIYFQNGTTYNQDTNVSVFIGSSNFNGIDNGNTFRYKIKPEGIATGKSLVFYNQIFNGANITDNESFRLNSNQTVSIINSLAIGVTLPTAKLDVRGAVRIGEVGAGAHISTTNPSLSILSTTSNDTILRLGTVGGTTTHFDFFRNNANGSLNIQGAQTGNNNIILGPTSGNVGIGNNAPTSRLVVKGNGLTTGTTLNITNSSNDSRLLVLDNGNIGVSVTTAFGNGVKVIGISNATTVPNANPSGGGILYVEAGALKYRGSSGTITTIAPA
jgi:hypothetical protein